MEAYSLLKKTKKDDKYRRVWVAIRYAPSFCVTFFPFCSIFFGLANLGNQDKCPFFDLSQLGHCRFFCVAFFHFAQFFLAYTHHRNTHTKHLSCWGFLFFYGGLWRVAVCGVWLAGCVCGCPAGWSPSPSCCLLAASWA